MHTDIYIDMYTHNNRSRLVCIQTQTDNPHNFEYHTKAAFRPKALVRGVLLLCCFWFGTQQNGDRCRRGSWSSWVPLWLSTAPPQLGDIFCHQQMPRSPKELINPSSSRQRAALTCPPSSEREKPGRIFSFSSAQGLLRDTLCKQRKGWSTVSRLAGQVFI